MVKKTKKETIEQEQPAVEAPGGEEKKDDLMARLEEAEKKAAENYDKYVRAVAELENYRKRAAREKADAIAYGNETLIRDVLPIIDSLDRATEHACKAADMGAFQEGFKLVKDQLLCCLGKHGVEAIAAVGTDFNPELHDAMLQVESEAEGHSKGVEEFEKGYLLRGRLLKPAKVSVGRASAGRNNIDKDKSALISD
ncbi:MAG: nucleotide exchange factor GrpE [Deltaproteobacteria bacterium]|nr:nucleotide exchange factor GrpE [Deltaproteobacteria bacterium]